MVSPIIESIIDYIYIINACILGVSFLGDSINLINIISLWMIIFALFMFF